MLEGLLSLNKEKGFTSMDCIAILRGITKQKRIGHAGTLDPMAEGVLPILLGSATKLSEGLMQHEKEYEAVAVFGCVTDTQDVTGNILKKTEDFAVSEEELKAALQGFVPGYDQLPPMYSARKVKGKKLYDLARKGEEVQRQTKWADIPEIQLLFFDGKRAGLKVRCGKGTYIRTLIHDLGERLGMGACMEKLTRTRVGSFTLDGSYTIAQFEEAFKAGKGEEKLIPVETLKAMMKEGLIS